MKAQRLRMWLRESIWPVVICGLLALIVVVFLFTGCAVGQVDGEQAWGMAVGNAKVTNCIQTTTLAREDQRNPDGSVRSSTENRISEISETCHTIAGGEVSEQGEGLLGALFAPLRILGGMISGASGG